ncbi:ribonuclease J [Candidatus Falkowbacteria bacterium]|nr:ribonuclease J [Candidatus Falkowbacteria bacterium]
MMFYKKSTKQKTHGGQRYHQKSVGTPRLKVIVLGGLEEVGRNMTLLEYENDIILIDMGLQFPEEDMPGIDYIIPNVSYLKGKEKNIRGVIITHGHYDHIGAIPHLVPRLGNPTIYGTQLTLAIIKKRQEDYKSTKLNLAVVKTDDVLALGKFGVEFIHVNHNIPDSVAVVVHTPVGTIMHTGDWKFDYTPVDERPADFAKISEVGRKGVLALMSDSTNAPEEGHQISEQEIGKNLKTLIEKAPGRIIIGTFSSLLSRVEQIIRIAEEMGKKVAVDGFSMKTNVEIIKVLGYLKVKQGTLIDIADVHNFPQEKIIIVCTGAQGEERAVLMRIANEEHRFIRIEPKDTVVFSSSVVPGNERTIQRLKDTLYRKGAEVVHYKMMDIHAGGHAKAEDIKLMIRLVNPKYFIPIEGSHSHLRMNAKIAESIGLDPKNIFVADNGQIIEFQAAAKEPYGAAGRLTPQRVQSDYVMVDGLGVGDVSQVVLRDRKMMAEDGMIVIIVTVDTKTGYLIGSPDIISRGFVYMRESKELIEQVRAKVKKLISDRDPKSAADNVFIKNKIRDNIGQFLFTKTERRPMVLPVIIEV